MAENSKIAWTDHTFNPWVGCMKVSEGCKNCYAETQMTRKPRWANTWGPPELTQRIKTSDDYWKKPIKWNREAEKLGVRYKVFCASLADVFEDNKQVFKWREELWGLIEQTPNLDWLLLTKRPQHVNAFSPFPIPDNVWIGTSAENQKQWDTRIPLLMNIPAKIRFVSIEPMLEPICIGLTDKRDIHWIIVGGESGSNHRHFEWNWARDIREQCWMVEIPFFMKQGAGKSQAHMPEIPDDLMIREFPE